MRLYPIFLAVALCGCSSLPFQERQKNATTEVSEKWSRDQKERLEVVMGALGESGGGSVDYSIDSSESGNGDQSLLSDFSTTIPQGMKLILLALGIGGLFFVVKLIINNSAAAKASLGLADEVIAKQIKKLEGRLEANGLTAEDRAITLNQIREMESARGRLR